MTEPASSTPKVPEKADLSPLTRVILDLLGKIPTSNLQPELEPRKHASVIMRTAALRSGFTSGALAIPPGPVGWLTVLPDLVALWRVQAQMIADIAALHGKSHLLTRENLLYCLFRHSAALAVRELVVQVGERFLVQRASVRVIQAIVRRVGVKMTQRAVGEGISRWLPIVGAVGVGLFAYFDTEKVARTAMDLFASNLEIAHDSTAALPEGSILKLRACYGSFVRCDANQDGALVADGDDTETSSFILNRCPEDRSKVTLRATNGKWLCCDGDRACQILANRDTAGAWELFTIEDFDAERITLRAHNGLLVYVDEARGRTLWADRPHEGPLTQFHIKIG